MSNQQIVPVPATSLYTIVFPLDGFKSQYDASFYNPGLTDGRATQEELNQVLREVEAVKKPFSSKVVCALWLFLLGFLASLAVMIAVPIICSGTGYFDEYGYYHDDTNVGGMLAGIFGGLFAMIFVIVYFIVYANRKTKETRVAVQALLDRVNPNFTSRGLRWHLPLHFPRWIELWKDYIGQAGVYNPPTMTQQYQTYPAPTGATYQMPGAQPQAYQNYGVQPQGYNDYNQQTQQFANYNPNQV